MGKSRQKHEAQKQAVRDAIIREVLPDVTFDGWSWAGTLRAAGRCGYERAVVRDIFPRGMCDVLDGYADMIDREMMATLARIDPDALRIRDRIRTAIIARFDALEPYREAERHAAAYWGLPPRQIKAAKIVWRCADRIWNWAGDTSEDYNHYTKRGLLSGILSSATLVWLDDDSDGLTVTRGFVDRRIENVMQLGRIIGKMKGAA